jgi:hypothetical protein
LAAAVAGAVDAPAADAAGADSLTLLSLPQAANDTAAIAAQTH